MEIVRRKGHVTAGDGMKELGISRTKISKLLDAMMKKNILKSHRNFDGDTILHNLLFTFHCLIG